ncbi:MAG: glycosyltransferase family 4 protein [Desulfovibrio sp.]
MKILMFGWEFPPHISGGLGTACQGLTQGLACYDTDVTFVLPTFSSAEKGEKFNIIGANQVQTDLTIQEVHHIRERIRVLSVLSPLQPYMTEEQYSDFIETNKVITDEEIFAGCQYDFSGNYGENLMNEVVRYSLVGGIVAARDNFDVIHAHDWMTIPAGIEAARVSGKPLIVHAHALEFDRSGEHVNQQVYDIEREGYHKADLVIAVSHYTKQRIINYYGVPEEKIRVVHNAVRHDAQYYKLKEAKRLKEKLVLFLGRITFQKGPDYFLEAAAKVCNKVENVRFAMAGNGDMFPRMVERMAELRLEDKFHFLGFVRGEDVERIYALSDIYVMPSVSEPFGITPLEAMVHNVPIIVSKQSGVSEILDHAIKIDFWDVDEMAEHIIKILSDEEYAQRLADLGSEQLKDIKWDIAAENVLNVYKEAIAQKEALV